MNKPVYLHFLDRELRTTENASFSDEQVFSFAFIATLVSLDPVYLGSSILYESAPLFPKTVDFLSRLEGLNYARYLSHCASESEFFVSRGVLYREDKERYPMYFGERASLWGKNPLVLPDSTTDIIAKGLLEKSLHRSTSDPLYEKREKVASMIMNSNGNAMTKNLFRPLIQTDIERFTISTDISFLYTKRYLDALHGTILHGIPNLMRYSSLCEDTFPDYDYQIYNLVLPHILYGSCQMNMSVDKAVEVVSITRRNDSLYPLLLNRLKALIRGLASLSLSKSMSFIRENVLNHLRSLIIAEPPKSFSLEESFARLLRLENACKKNYPNIIDDMPQTETILLVVATQTELKRLLDFYSCHEAHIKIGYHTYWLAGVVKGRSIYIVKTQMSSRGQSGAILTIEDAIQDLSPKYIIMVGIAFGLKEDKEELTDVLVSQSIQDYELVRVGESEIRNRGDKIPASITLVDSFEAAAASFKDAGVHIGMVLTGDKLVDNEDFTKRLKETFPDAIGGEMEGEGLISSGFRNNTDWILVKGICDWGHDKDDQYQERAALNAIRLVDSVIKDYL